MQHKRRAATILIAEDEPALRKLLQQLLTDRGYALLLACDGAEALRIADAYDGKIDLLLTDIVMPEMDGVELSQRLNAVRPDTRVMLMSGYDRRLFVVNGGWQFIRKPYNMAELLKKVTETLATDPEEFERASG